MYPQANFQATKAKLTLHLPWKEDFVHRAGRARSPKASRPGKRNNAGYWSPYTIATLYANLGDRDQAFRWLNTGYQERDAGVLGLKTDYLLHPLRSDARFPELVREVGLPQ
jgi:hypothetical protein